MDHKRLGRQAAAACAIVAIVGIGSSAHAATDLDAAKRGARWITTQQAPDGSFSDPHPAAATGEDLAAMIAGEVTGAPVDDALSYLRAHGKAGATEGAYTGWIIAGIVAAGQNPRSFGGVDYVKILHSQYNATTGAYDSNSFLADLIAANGANAARDALPAQALAYIDAAQCPDGGSAARTCSDGSDVVTTAWAINVLVASGHGSDQGVGRARNYLTHVERADGGFAPSSSSNFTNSDATGLALSAINALGEDATTTPWAKTNGNPVKALIALQTSDGSFRTNKDAQAGNLMSTVNAVPGLAHDSYPVLPANQKPKTTPTPRPTQQATSGGGTTQTAAPSRASVTVDGLAAAPVVAHEVSASSGSTTSSSKHHGATSRGDTKPTRSPYVLGFGGISTRPGGLSMAVWGAIAAGCAGIGVGIWFLRARLR